MKCEHIQYFQLEHILMEHILIPEYLFLIAPIGIFYTSKRRQNITYKIHVHIFQKVKRIFV